MSAARVITVVKRRH